jgi:uncharacterized protein YggE
MHIRCGDKMDTRQKLITLSALVIVFAVLSSSLYVIMAYRPLEISTNQETDHTIVVSGKGELKVSPDTVKILLGVITESASTTEASSKNAEILNAILKSLESLGIGKESIQTTSYNIYPVYKYSNDGSPPVLVGYRVTHSLEIVIEGTNSTQLGAKAGKVLDESVLAGANQVSGVQFTVSNQTLERLRNQALQEAVNDATAKANLMAASLDVKITGVQTASESISVPNPIYYSELKGGADTNIIPGQVSISASVQITYIID